MAIYSDVNITGEKPLVEDAHAVGQAILNILRTRKGERLFLPEFGADLEQLLFEPIDEETAFAIKSLIIKEISAWDPRIEIDVTSSEVIPYPDENKYVVKLVFSIRGLDDEKFELVEEVRR